MATQAAITNLALVLKIERGQNLGEESLRVWLDVLRDVPDELLGRAIGEVLRTQTGDFPITVGAFYQAALKLARLGMPTGGEAWEMVLRALRDCNYLPGTGLLGGQGWGPVHHLPFIVRRAAEQVGIMHLANGNTDMAARAKFIQFYDEMNHVFEQPILASGGDPARIDAFGAEYEAKRARMLAPGCEAPALEEGGDES